MRRFTLSRTNVLSGLTIMLLISSFVFFGCSDNTAPVNEYNQPQESSIIAPPSEYAIEVVSSNAKAGGGAGPTIGQLHNDVLNEFFAHHDLKSAKIKDPEVFFTLLDDAFHAVVDTSVYGDISTETFQADYVPILFEMRDIGAVDVFSGEILNSDIFGQYYYQKGWLTASERDWIVGFIDAVMATSDPTAAQIAINSYTFNNGLPVPKSNLGVFYSITVNSLGLWGDSTKWGMDWRSVGAGLADGLSGWAGLTVGGVAGGIYGAVAGSGAVNMMYDAWDEYNGN